MKKNFKPWWEFHNHVTLLHGTSSAYLESIRQNGLQAKLGGIEEMAREIVSSYLPENEISFELIRKVIDKSTTGQLRKHQEGNRRSLFYSFYPSTAAQNYAVSYYEDGGEFAHNVRYALQSLTGRKFEPRFKGSKPVVIAIKVPYDKIGRDHSVAALEQAMVNAVWSNNPSEYRTKSVESSSVYGMIDCAIQGRVGASEISHIAIGERDQKGQWQIPLDLDSYDPKREQAIYNRFKQKLAEVNSRNGNLMTEQDAIRVVWPKRAKSSITPSPLSRIETYKNAKSTITNYGFMCANFHQGDFSATLKGLHTALGDKRFRLEMEKLRASRRFSNEIGRYPDSVDKYELMVGAELRRVLSTQRLSRHFPI